MSAVRHYADPGFIRSFGFYFISDRLVGDVLDEDRFVGSKRIFWDEYYAMTAKLEGSTEVSEIHRLVRFIESSGFIHQDRFQGYLKLKENFGDEGILNCFAALFVISSYQILSWPAEKILYDHYSEIVCEVGSNYTQDFFHKRATDRVRRSCIGDTW